MESYPGTDPALLRVVDYSRFTQFRTGYTGTHIGKYSSENAEQSPDEKTHNSGVPSYRHVLGHRHRAQLERLIGSKNGMYRLAKFIKRINASDKQTYERGG